MKKNDIILIVSLLAVIGIFVLITQLVSKPGAYAVIKIDGKIVEKLPLDQDTKVEIHGAGGGTNTVVVKNGSVFVQDADCPDRYCVKHKKIKADTETIVCLPNKMVIEIVGSKNDKSSIQLDEFAQ
ncbi:NusG domain II-containing protein [Anaerosporobacter faecicola]|uniref:NusG domain II-containing protein n=1 Tax=Anaerosporobacter faecicola TaxID=2718714 RepID=UPI00143A08D6|nr:NusG domain II-containing protein [Anaerosporobacter faecicola]